MQLPLASASYDAAYAVEATCHAPDRVGVYGEIARVLKPGARFAVYEWCLTDRYDANNPTHLTIKRDIESGDSLPDMISTHAVLDAVRRAGLTVEDSRDLAHSGDASTPWYLPLEGDGGLNVTSVRRSAPGRFVSNRLIGLFGLLWFSAGVGGAPMPTQSTIPCCSSTGMASSRGRPSGSVISSTISSS